jgi:hypothetical protein
MPGHPNFPRPSQMVRSCMGMIFGEVGLVFEWSGKGREAYSRKIGLAEGVGGRFALGVGWP